MEVLFCKVDGLVLGGMQFRVLVEVPLCETDGRVLGGMQFAVLITVLVPVLFRALMDSGTLWAQFSEIAGGCWGACSLGWWCRCCFVLLLEVQPTAWAYFPDSWKL